jgi:hypothetical protein
VGRRHLQETQPGECAGAQAVRHRTVRLFDADPELADDVPSPVLAVDALNKRWFVLSTRRRGISCRSTDRIPSSSSGYSCSMVYLLNASRSANDTARNCWAPATCSCPATHAQPLRRRASSRRMAGACPAAGRPAHTRPDAYTRAASRRDGSSRRLYDPTIKQPCSTTSHRTASESRGPARARPVALGRSAGDASTGMKCC